MKKELIELKDTYFSYWEEMKEEILSRDPYPSPEFVSELQSILNRAYMNALEVGFNEGLRRVLIGKKQITKDEENDDDVPYDQS
jgi:hypothetical protein